MVTLPDALNYLKLGFSVVPIMPRRKTPFGKLLPLVNGKPSWKPYQEQQATEAEIQGWFKRYRHMNMAVACGGVSNGLVVIDFDIEAERNWQKWREMTAPLSDALPVVQTGKGRHVYLYYNGEGTSTHLAKTTSGGILIESRGVGGLCMLPPSTHPNGHQYTWLVGSAEKIPVVSHRQYLALMGAAASLNEMEERLYVPQKRQIEEESTVCVWYGYAASGLRDRCIGACKTRANGNDAGRPECEAKSLFLYIRTICGGGVVDPHGRDGGAGECLSDQPLYPRGWAGCL